ncbi:MAG: GNAT family N-acetyltransferase [Chitinispirillaceae bacterium]|nr:GNAT family N-acetyltransferase [Chitinispirillaceae bacterium]
MLKKFQSEEVIRSQLSDGWRYFLAEIQEKTVGYTGIIPDYLHEKMMISKLYVTEVMRGKGAGEALIRYVEQESAVNGLTRLWLTVNRFNVSAIEWYVHHGFSVIDEAKKDIGGGFFMDDYIMEKNILSHPPPR